MASLPLFALGALGFRQPVVGNEILEKALSQTVPDRAFEADGIAFFESRLGSWTDADPSLHLRLASLYLSRFHVFADRTDLEKSRAHLDHVILSGSAGSPVLCVLASLHLAEHRFPEALAAAGRAFHIAGPDDREAAGLAYFDALLASGRYDQALELFRALNFRRPSFQFLTRRSRLHELSGEWERAKVAMRKARQEASAFSYPPPVVAWSLIQLGSLEVRTGNDRSALGCYREALECVPGHPQALEGLARLALARDGNARAAKRLYREALQRGGPPSIYLDLMEIDRDLGDTLGARRWKDSILSINRRNPETERLRYRTLAHLHLETPGTREAAIRYARMDVENRPTPESHDLLGWALFQGGALASAYHASRAALEWGSHDPGIVYHAAMISWHAGRKAEAESLLSSAPEALDNLGALSMNAREILMLHSHRH